MEEIISAREKLISMKLSKEDKGSVMGYGNIV